MTPLKAAIERVDRDMDLYHRDHAADLRLILAALAERGWRPIETAPRDCGVSILIAINVPRDGVRVYQARWSEVAGCFSSLNGFTLFDGAHAWMPLPDGPEVEAPPHLAYLFAEPSGPEPAPAEKPVIGEIRFGYLGKKPLPDGPEQPGEESTNG